MLHNLMIAKIRVKGLDTQELLTELHEKAYKKNSEGGCTTRAQLLFLALQKLGYKPKILRYFVKGEKDKDADKRKKLHLLDGSLHPSHVVVELDGNILDANFGIIIKKTEYEEKLSKKSKSEIEFFPCSDNIDVELCKQYVEKYNLQKFKLILHNTL